MCAGRGLVPRTDERSDIRDDTARASIRPLRSRGLSGDVLGWRAHGYRVSTGVAFSERAAHLCGAVCSHRASLVQYEARDLAADISRALHLCRARYSMHNALADAYLFPRHLSILHRPVGIALFSSHLRKHGGLDAKTLPPSTHGADTDPRPNVRANRTSSAKKLGEFHPVSARRTDLRSLCTEVGEHHSRRRLFGRCGRVAARVRGRARARRA